MMTGREGTTEMKFRQIFDAEKLMRSRRPIMIHDSLVVMFI